MAVVLFRRPWCSQYISYNIMGGKKKKKTGIGSYGGGWGEIKETKIH